MNRSRGTGAVGTSTSEDHRASSLWVLFAAAVAFALAIVPTVALADNDPAASPPPNVSAALLDAIEGGGVGPAEASTNLQAAEELPHADLSREQAVALFEGVFSAQLEAPAGIFDDFQVARFLAPNVAVIESDQSVAPASESGGEPQPAVEGEHVPAPAAPALPADQIAGSTLLTATTPLQAPGADGEAEPLDLSLEHHDGELQPANPVADVGVPQELGEGISLPGPDIQISVAGAPENRSPSTVSGSVAVYPNVASDTDLAVAPTPTGVETLTQLRTPAAPVEQSFELTLPQGAELSETSEGGAEVKDGDDLLVSVSAPTAMDAAGNPVPVELAVDNGILTLTAAPPTDAIYPILIDPLFQTYEWAKSKYWQSGICNNSFGTGGTSSCNNREEWGYTIYTGLPSPHILPDNIYNGNTAKPGIFIRSKEGGKLWDHATVSYAVPRYYKDPTLPTSFIKGMTLSNVLWEAYSSYLSPYLFMGLYDPVHDTYPALYSHEGLTGHGLGDLSWPYVFTNASPQTGQPNTDVKMGLVRVQATETQPNQFASVYVGNASIELGDVDVPQAPVPAVVSSWVNDSPVALGFSTGDSGLGVYSVKATAEQRASTGAVLSWMGAYGCQGVGDAACPLKWKSTEAGQPTLKYDPALLPNGPNFLDLIAEDPVGNKSAVGYAQVLVDHQAPKPSWSGTLTEQSKVGINLAQYALKYSATDGDVAAPAALAPFGGAGTEPGKTQKPSGIAVDANGDIYVVDKDNNRVEKFDATGKFLSQFGSAGSGNGQFKEPRGIAIAPNGDLWIADSGNSRVQHFSSTGSYKSQFGSKGAATNQFMTPYGIAVTIAPPGSPLAGVPVVYVSDSATNRVAGFSESGAYFGNVIGTSANPAAAAVFGEPSGIAIDPKGNLWVADAQNNRVQRFNAEGKFVLQFGTKGSGNGQTSGPVNVSIAPSGNVIVVDGANHRIEVFNTSGEYLRQFGSSGSSNSQFSDPKGIAFGAGNVAYVSDAANHRIAKWSHADLDRQSGVVSTEVRMDGSVVEPKYIVNCPTESCAISNREWTLNADKYPVGTHTLSVVTTDGVGLSALKSMQVETHGDLLAPSLALSGSMTEQVTVGETLPSYTLKAVATDPGSAEERKSGVASVSIKVDGTTVSSISPGCPAGGCSLTREWTLTSTSYSTGSHAVEVIATDAAGRVQAKTMTINIQRDITPPLITAPNTLFTAPEGWVEQLPYAYAPSAADSKGFGVVSLKFVVDNTVIKKAEQTCAGGSCSLGLNGTLDVSAYGGGAHHAELIAVDGAGNTSKRPWTLNVDPDGSISVAELEDTIEAVEGTTDAELLAPGPEASDGVELEGQGPGFATVGAGVPGTIKIDPSEGIALEVLPDGALPLPCEEAEAEPEGSGTEANEYCEPIKQIPGTETQLESVEIAPTNTGPNASPVSLVGGAAAIASNTATNVDSLTRPLYDGLLTFKTIRDSGASESFVWNINLYPGQETKQIDAQHVEVDYAGGHIAFTVEAVAAHDAIGTSVATTLSVSNDNMLTLTVQHKAKPYVYPVVAGTGWEGGYFETTIPGPPDEQELREERERIAREERERQEEEWANGENGGGGEEPGTEEEANGELAKDAFITGRAAWGPPQVSGGKRQPRASPEVPLYAVHA